MKKCSLINKTKVLDHFPKIDTLLEREVSSESLGYSSYVVSAFDHWLTEDEYEREMSYVREHRAKEILTKRLQLFSIFYPDVFYYDYNDDVLEFQNKSEYFDFLTNTLLEENEEILCNISLGFILEFGGDVFTDIIGFALNTIFHNVYIFEQSPCVWRKRYHCCNNSSSVR